MDVYKLVNGKYELLPLETLPEGGRMVWLDEIGLGIGYEQGMRGDWQRDWLYWYDRSGVKYPTDNERAEQEKLAKERAEAIALQECLDKERAELAKQEAEAIALQEKLAKEQAEAIALQERLDKEHAEAIAYQERQEKEKLAAYLRSLGINPDEI
jgi:hypothetical protein